MGTLMLDTLEIRNFRAFKHVRIEQLGRVNLITGKNNVNLLAFVPITRTVPSDSTYG